MIANIDTIEKGQGFTAIAETETTATSDPIDARGKNAILLKITISVQVKKWTTKLTGCFTRDGTYVDLYELANTGTMTQMSYQTNASKMILFKGIPSFVKVTATEDEDTGKCAVEYQLLNV